MECIKRSIAFSVAAMTFSAALVAAQDQRGFQGGYGPGMHRGGPGMQQDGGMRGPGAMRNFFQELGITEEQKTKLLEIRKNSNMRELREKLREERGKLRDMLKDHSKGEKEILAQLDKVSDAQVEMNQIRVKNVLGMRSILSAEQFQKLAQQMENRRPPMGGMRGGERGPGMTGRGMRPDHGMGPQGFGPQGEMGGPGGGPPPQFQDGGMPGGEGPDGGMMEPFDIQ